MRFFYRLPNHNNFLDLVYDDFHKLNPENKEVYILSDMNINVLVNGKSYLEKDFKISDRNITAQSRKYKEFCSFFSLSQLIQSTTRITINSSTLLDHVLTNTPEKITHKGTHDTSISDHQIIFCTRKSQKYKPNCHNYIQFRSFRNYTVDNFENILRSQQFPNYSEFDNVDVAYSDFISKLTNAINTSAPCRQKRAKAKTEEWFDGEIAEAISVRNKLYKKFKKNRLTINQQNFREAKYKVEDLTKHKKREFFENKLSENVGRPKELWKTIKSIGLPSKKSTTGNICLKDHKGELQFGHKLNANIFKNYFSTIASNLVNKLPVAPNIFTEASTLRFYEANNITPNSFNFHEIDENYIYKQLISINPHKAAGIDNISGRFLKDGSKVLARPISQICNLSIKLSTFPQKCKIAKITPLYKKGNRTDAGNYRPI